jgi:hypothetical protein
MQAICSLAFYYFCIKKQGILFIGQLDKMAGTVPPTADLYFCPNAAISPP